MRDVVVRFQSDYPIAAFAAFSFPKSSPRESIRKRTDSPFPSDKDALSRFAPFQGLAGRDPYAGRVITGSRPGG